MEPISTAHITLGCDMEPGYYRTCQNKHINHKKMVAKHKYYGETYISTEKYVSSKAVQIGGGTSGDNSACSTLFQRLLKYLKISPPFDNLLEITHIHGSTFS